ncbi:hypothetical protein HQ362_01780, partial [Rhodococcus sp. BP-314]|nr:hypothetical protein [Rhodococcus sp. BP-314]
MSENPPDGPQYGSSPDPERPDLGKNEPGRGYPPPPQNYPPAGGTPVSYTHLTLPTNS